MLEVECASKACENQAMAECTNAQHDNTVLYIYFINYAHSRGICPRFFHMMPIKNWFEPF